MAEDGPALCDAPEEIRGDREVVMAAVAESAWTLRYASEELRGDREVVMAAIALEGHALQHARDELKGDREVVMTAIAQDGMALEHAAEELRGDHEVVMTAMAENGWALQHATEEVRADKEIVEAALARASDSGYRPIGLKARLNLTCLQTKFHLCFQGGGKARGSGTLLFWAHALFFSLCSVFSLSPQILKPSLLSEVVGGSVPAGLSR